MTILNNRMIKRKSLPQNKKEVVDWIKDKKRSSLDLKAFFVTK
jgi:hypothetical protein